MPLATGPVLTKSVDVTGDTVTIADPGSTKTVRVLGANLRAMGTAAALRLHSGSTDHDLADLAARGVYSLPVDDNGWFDGGAGESLKLSATGRIVGLVRYQIIA